MNEHAVLEEFAGPPAVVHGMRGTLQRGPWSLGQAWHVFQSLGALGSNIRTQINHAQNSDAQRGAHVEAARAADAARKRADRAEMSPEQLAGHAARVAALGVAEVLGDGEASQTDTGAGGGSFKKKPCRRVTELCRTSKT